MTTCYVIDETSDDDRFPDHENFPHWEQDFARVPTIGEYIVKDGKGLKVRSVIWQEGNETWLTVEWDGWRQ